MYHMPPTIKISLFGAANSGKSSAVRRFVDETFTNEYAPTVGAKIASVYGNKVRMDMWELAGPEHFSILSPMLWKGSHVVGVFFSITDRNHSFERATIWVESLRDHGCKVPIVLVGTKIDLPLTEHQVTSQMGKSFVTRSGITSYQEISSRSGQNLVNTFQLLAELGLRNVVCEDSEHLNPPEWVPDNCCHRCSQCNVEFTFSNRRHHCRSCGFLFCGACTSRSIPLPQFGFPKPVRVCDGCEKTFHP